ncbi:hypothetical protein Gotur_031103, partial [Gossypium turneri]
ESEKLRLCEVFTSVWDSESLLGYIRIYVFVRFSSPHGHREMYSPELNSALVHIRLLYRNLVTKKGFLDKVEVIRPSKLGQKRHSMRNVIVWLRDIYQNCGTLPVLV